MPRGVAVANIYVVDQLSNTTLPHNLIKKKLRELIEQAYDIKCSLYLACNDINVFFLLLNNLNDISCGHVRKCVMVSNIF